MKSTILLGVFSLALSACANLQYVSKSTPVRDVRHVASFESAGYISYIDKGNQGVLSDSLSAITAGLLDSIITGSRILPVDTLIRLDADTKRRVYREMEYLVQILQANRKAASVPITPTIDSLLTESGRRFGMATIGVGFGRRKGNYAGQAAKAVGIGILTLGLYAPIPVKSNLMIYSMVVDAEQDQVTFSSRTVPIEKDPTDAKVVSAQFRKAYEGYFYPTPR